jgi:hypothetical protein
MTRIAKPKKSEPVNIYFRDGDESTVRVWREGWYGDQFEVFPSSVWYGTLAPAFTRLSFKVIDKTFEDD